jgi:site-specific DNA-methyltransferase (adenine-specific)
MPVELLNIDCMEYMKTLPDKAFDLAVVDPPYGLDIANSPRIVTDKGLLGNDWDKEPPTSEYFTELFRISKNQIIWGANYFVQLWQTPCKGFIFWDKMQPAPSFADGEFAWTSLDIPAKCFRFRYYGNIEGKTSASDKVHPTQKPRALYDWLYKNYAKPGFKILDTHLGSGNSAIVAFHKGFDFVGCEKDKNIYEKALEHYKKATDLGLFANI